VIHESKISGYRDPQLSAELRQFYSGAVGQRMLPEIERYLSRCLPDLFGFHALQIGVIAPGADFFEPSRIRHRALMDRDAANADFCGLSGSLPIRSESVDFVFLAHSLDYAVDPYQVLREVERVLVKDGHVLILGFNPLSFYGLWKLFRGWKGRMPWCGRFYLATRVGDWLSLLGFEPLDRSYIGFRPPVRRASVSDRLVFLDRLGPRYLRYFGGAYLLLAKKYVAPITPIRPRWRPRRALFPAGNELA